MPLTNGSGVFSQSLGEFALGAILYFAKDFRRMVRNQEAGRWEQFDMPAIAGQTVGIVGYGDIGRAVATRVRAMGMRVLAVKRHGPPFYNVDPLVSQIYGPERPLEMIAQCDYIVAAAPLTPETRGMIGEAEFARHEARRRRHQRRPRPGHRRRRRWCARCPNAASRAPAWTSSTRSRCPTAIRFYRLENVLLSPHCADHTPDWLEHAMQFFI